ncbi:hypothetical protein AB205_0075900 [Aquarana catesbeiana]|uniref:Uncharacterized protein n=1 Tax=Aquarana catesbeiana TaxID=8400 RepID=A0A2G9RM64_AQUCT|nr:hypothetical protein AB205_0075900 [Aquarana catesbeiana]
MRRSDIIAARSVWRPKTVGRPGEDGSLCSGDSLLLKGFVLSKTPFTLRQFSCVLALEMVPEYCLSGRPNVKPEYFHTGAVPLQDVRKSPASSTFEAVWKRCIQRSQNAPALCNEWAALRKRRNTGIFNPFGR